jgi:hypothetical protein
MTKNHDLQQRRDAAFARGLGNQLPVYVERARNANCGTSRAGATSISPAASPC